MESRQNLWDLLHELHAEPPQSSEDSEPVARLGDDGAVAKHNQIINPGGAPS